MKKLILIPMLAIAILSCSKNQKCMNYTYGSSIKSDTKYKLSNLNPVELRNLSKIVQIEI